MPYNVNRGNQFNVDLGRFNTSQSSRANILNAGTVQFASWWGDLNNDGVVLAVPYSSAANNTGKADRWPVSGWSSSPDFTYSIYVDAAATLNINTCNSATAFDTYLTVYNTFGSIVAHNDDSYEPGCGQYQSKVVTTLPIGWYFINVQGWQGAVGNFHLNVVKQ